MRLDQRKEELKLNDKHQLLLYPMTSSIYYKEKHRSLFRL